jgi:hypothetical protein
MQEHIRGLLARIMGTEIRNSAYLFHGYDIVIAL